MREKHANVSSESVPGTLPEASSSTKDDNIASPKCSGGRGPPRLDSINKSVSSSRIRSVATERRASQQAGDSLGFQDMSTDRTPGGTRDTNASDTSHPGTCSTRRRGNIESSSPVHAGSNCSCVTRSTSMLGGSEERSTSDNNSLWARSAKWKCPSPIVNDLRWLREMAARKVGEFVMSRPTDNSESRGSHEGSRVSLRHGNFIAVSYTGARASGKSRALINASPCADSLTHLVLHGIIWIAV